MQTTKEQNSAQSTGLDQGTILAVGASGKFAGLVIPELMKRGGTIRGLVRNANDADKVRSLGVAEVAIGDLADAASIQAALEGIESTFYIAPAFMRNEAKVGVDFVQAAKAAGVRRIVFSSVIHPVLSELSNHAAKARVEEAILDSGLEYTFLQPAMFFQNFAASWPKLYGTGVLAEPWSAETRFTRVDYRDVAEVAAIALTEDRLLYGTFELCAEGNLNRHDVARVMSEILGREMKVETLDPKALKPDKELLAMFEWYDHHALLGSALTLRAILAREPRSLRAYINELAQQR